MSKTFQDLSNNSNLRDAIATKLGADVANIPEENVEALAKSLGLAPLASVVEYTTVKTKKVGAYLSCPAINGAGRDGGKLFARLGEPTDEVTPDQVTTLRTIADGLADRSAAIHAIADAAEADDS